MNGKYFVTVRPSSAARGASVAVGSIEVTADGEHDIRMSRVTAVQGEHSATPPSFILRQNYPNPFNSSTVIGFSLPRSQEVELTVYNLAGQKVIVLVDGEQTAGTHFVRWDGRDEQGRELASGVYLYRQKAGSQVETRKLLLLR